jgi:uncharacterized protein YuzE
MKVVYDPDKDILQITFLEKPIEETAQIAPGFILDYDEDGHVIGLELRAASLRVDHPYEISYLVGPADEDKPMPQVKN